MRKACGGRLLYSSLADDCKAATTACSCSFDVCTHEQEEQVLSERQGAKAIDSPPDIQEKTTQILRACVRWLAGSLAAFCNNGSYSFQKSLPKTLLHFLQLSRWHFRLPQLLLLSRTPTIASSAPPSCLKRLTVGLCLNCNRQWCRMTYTHTHTMRPFSSIASFTHHV